MMHGENGSARAFRLRSFRGMVDFSSCCYNCSNFAVGVFPLALMAMTKERMRSTSIACCFCAGGTTTRAVEVGVSAK